jgi:hypothetical protein
MYRSPWCRPYADGVIAATLVEEGERRLRAKGDAASISSS